MDKNIRIRFDGNADQLVRELKRLGREVDKTGDEVQQLRAKFERLGKIGRKLMPLSIALAAVGAASVKLSVDAAETRSKFVTVFGDMTKAMDTFIKSVEQVIPSTREELEAMLGSLQDLLVPLGMVPEAAANMSASFVSLAGDLASFNNIPMAQALDAIRAGLIGEAEPLRRFGILVNVAQVEAKALEMGLMELKGELTSTARATAILQIATEQSSFAIGDAARTADSAANQIKFLMRDIKELGTQIGEHLVPIVRDMVAQLRPLVQSFGKMSQEQQALIVKTAALVAALAPLLLLFNQLGIALTFAIRGVSTLSAGLATGLLVALKRLAGPLAVATTMLKGMSDAATSAARQAALVGEAWEKSLQTMDMAQVKEQIEILQGQARTVEGRISRDEGHLGLFKEGSSQWEGKMSTIRGHRDTLATLMDRIDMANAKLEELAEAAAKSAAAFVEARNARWPLPGVRGPLRPGVDIIDTTKIKPPFPHGVDPALQGRDDVKEDAWDKFARRLGEANKHIQTFGRQALEVGDLFGVLKPKLKAGLNSLFTAIGGFAQGFGQGGPMGIVTGGLAALPGVINAFKSLMGKSDVPTFFENYESALDRLSTQTFMLAGDFDRLRSVAAGLGDDLVDSLGSVASLMGHMIGDAPDLSKWKLTGGWLAGAVTSGTGGGPSTPTFTDADSVAKFKSFIESFGISVRDLIKAAQQLGLPYQDLLEVLLGQEGGDMATASAQLRTLMALIADMIKARRDAPGEEEEGETRSFLQNLQISTTQAGELISVNRTIEHNTRQTSEGVGNLVTLFEGGVLATTISEQIASDIVTGNAGGH